MLLIRYISEITATFGMVQALRLVPLSTVGAILQTTPLVVALGAVLLAAVPFAVIWVMLTESSLRRFMNSPGQA